MATVTVEKPAPFGAVKLNERPVSPVVDGVVFGGRPSNQVGDNGESRLVDNYTLRILSAGALEGRKVSVFAPKNPAFGVRYSVGGGSDSKDRRGKGDREHENKCAKPGCNNPRRAGDNFCASCRASIDRDRAKSRNTLSSDGTRQVPSAHRRHDQ